MISADRFHDVGWVRLPSRIEMELVNAVVASLDSGGSSGGTAPDRVMDAWRSSRPVRELATHPMVLDTLATLYRRRPIPFQTLNFGRGTKQAMHADSVHFDSLPHGLMCGVWVALESVGPEQGPVQYVSGSHRLPQVRPEDALAPDGRFSHRLYEQLVAARLDGLPVERFHAEAGEVLVWHADLAHGGAPVTAADSTRWSQVTHYFFEGGTYITPLMSDAAASEYYVREPLVDITSGRRVVHEHEGKPARFVHLRNGRSRLLDPGHPAPSLPERVASTSRGVRRRLSWRLASWRDR